MIKRALPVPSNEVVVIGHMIFCPACQCGHLFYSTYGGKPQWTFDGNLEWPTFSPSMLVYPGHEQPRCHSFVRKGKIEFLSDCTHDMKGQTVELGEI